MEPKSLRQFAFLYRVYLFVQDYHKQFLPSISSDHIRSRQTFFFAIPQGDGPARPRAYKFAFQAVETLLRNAFFTENISDRLSAIGGSKNTELLFSAVSLAFDFFEFVLKARANLESGSV